MYNVLLVDDETNVTQWLANTIPWSNLGVDIVNIASDGLQALEILEKAPTTDLLITDIKMPRMDGLTLLKNVRTRYPNTHCILLTAFGEFEYAMEALKLGVDNYLMKPIQIQELTETIETTLDNIYIKRKNMSTLFQENLLRRWITGTISRDELGERSVLTDINIYQSCYCAIVMRKKDSAISLQAFSQECISLFPDGLETSSVWDNNGHYIILTGGNSIPENLLEDILIKTAVQFSIYDKIIIAIGPSVSDCMDIHISYENACNLLKYSLENNGENVIRCTSFQKTNELPNVTDTISETASPLILRAVSYIQENYSKGASIKEFCSLLNVNAAYLGYLFKKETGSYFNSYLNNFRVQKAMKLLCQTGEKINDIATMTGYTTTSHFISTFKKKTGLSPLKYREIYGGKS